MAKMSKETKIEYEIVQELGVLSESDDGKKKMEVNIISWNKGEAKFDIRPWYYNEYGERIRCGKMVGLNMEQAAALKDILNEIEF